MLIDSHHRRINYLRLSVTDRCNFHCLYCKPDTHERCQLKPSLSCEDYTRIASACVRLGIHKIRLTGGEPLLRHDLPDLIENLSQLSGLHDLALTTNGHFLSHQIETLAEAGLHRVNVSIDSLKPDRFQRITGSGNLFRVLEGLEKASQSLPGPIKINAVAFRGFNDDEILDFARLSLRENWHIRFIEPMPMHSKYHLLPGELLPVREIQEKIQSVFPIHPVTHNASSTGPSKLFQIAGGKGFIGFIGAMTDNFCAQCNRIRVTFDGKLKGCLFSNKEMDLLEVLRHGAEDGELEARLHQVIHSKPRQHPIDTSPTFTSTRTMVQIGG